MLEGLDKIDWGKLEHAYGDASDVPQLIRDLASEDANLRDRALYELYGNIIHQGTRYQATPYAIPFIFELIREDSVPDKADLIKFTVDLALGYPEAYLPKGPNVEDWVIDAEQLKQESETEELENVDQDWLKHIDAFIDSYKATLKEITTYYICLENENPDIKIMAIFAIAWFREQAKTSMAKLRNLIKKEVNELIIANTLICLSMLGSYLEDKNDEQLFRKYLSESPNLLVKVSAAIALVNILEEDVDLEPIDYILKNVFKIIEIKPLPYEFPWNDGELLGFISEVIKYCAVQTPEKIVPDLTKVLPKLTGERALNVIYSLLWIVFPEFPEQGSWTLKLLNKYQKMVLKVLGDTPEFWKDGEMLSEDLKELFKEYKLPPSQIGLRKLLQLDSK